jgi:hypothetical protein
VAPGSFPGRAVKARQKDGALTGIRMRHPDGREEEIETKVVLDCSGQATFLANQKVTGPKYIGNYDKQVGFLRARARSDSRLRHGRTGGKGQHAHFL